MFSDEPKRNDQELRVSRRFRGSEEELEMQSHRIIDLLRLEKTSKSN